MNETDIPKHTETERLISYDHDRKAVHKYINNATDLSPLGRSDEDMQGGVPKDNSMRG